MTHRSVTISNPEQDLVATADVELLGEFYSGHVRIDRMSQLLRLLFEEYEDVVNDQMLSLLDRIEDQIEAIPFEAVFDDGCKVSVKDLQLFPKGATVAFRVLDPAKAG